MWEASCSRLEKLLHSASRAVRVPTEEERGGSAMTTSTHRVRVCLCGTVTVRSAEPNLWSVGLTWPAKQTTKQRTRKRGNARRVRREKRAPCSSSAPLRLPWARVHMVLRVDGGANAEVETSTGAPWSCSDVCSPARQVWLNAHGEEEGGRGRNPKQKKTPQRSGGATAIEGTPRM